MKVCILCFEFSRKNVDKQPWNYLYEIARSLGKQGIDTVVITDNHRRESPPDAVVVRSVDRLYTLSGCSPELCRALEAEDPDVVISLQGISSAWKRRAPVQKPMIGVLTSPLYSVGELLNLGPAEWLRHWRYLAVHLTGSLVPALLIRRWADQFRSIVVLSEENQRRLAAAGVRDEVVRIPAGMPSDLPSPGCGAYPLPEGGRDQVPSVLYFTSPLTLRGTDTLLQAFGMVRSRLPCRLVFLARMDDERVARDLALLKRTARNLQIDDSVGFVTTRLSREEVAGFLARAAIVCLPFKLVISDTPVSILEAMALGKPVISTNVGSIPELIRGRGIVVEPDDPAGLAEAICRLLADPSLADRLGGEGMRYMAGYPRWDACGEVFADLVRSVGRQESGSGGMQRAGAAGGREGDGLPNGPDPVTAER
jgi:phosphatidylinositol alpha-1,6-mannosyltransferase